MILNASPCEDIGLYGTATREMIFFPTSPFRDKICSTQRGRGAAFPTLTIGEERREIFPGNSEKKCEMRWSLRDFFLLKRVFTVFKWFSTAWYNFDMWLYTVGLDDRPLKLYRHNFIQKEYDSVSRLNIRRFQSSFSTFRVFKFKIIWTAYAEFWIITHIAVR